MSRNRGKRAMTEHAGFLKAICDNPEDDTPRLVYADWLDEHGDTARAEFIRVQCQLARSNVPTGKLHRLRRRERELLLEHEMAWTAPLHGLVQRARFVRGFPERITVMAEDFLGHGRKLFRLTPVRHVILTEIGDHLPALADSPLLGRIEALEF